MKTKTGTEGKCKAERPARYSQELADRVCVEISTSNKSLKTICAMEGMPTVRTVLHWQNTNEQFLAQYRRAKEEQADYLAEEIIEIADDSSHDTKEGRTGAMENREWLNRSKLRVETRKWVASKLRPKKYGDKIDVKHEGDIRVQQVTGMEVK